MRTLYGFLSLVTAVVLMTEAGLALGVVQTFEGESAYDQFGISVTALDLNGDLWTDLVVGANTNDAGGTAAGRAYVFYGGVSDSTPDVVLTGPVPGGHFGWCVSGVGDVDGDGIDDLAVGAHFTSDVNTRSGKVYVFLGSDPPDGIPDLVITESLYDARLGYAISGGDFNGDGYADIAVGAPNAHERGMVRIFLGADPPDTVCDLTLHGEATYDFFGSALTLRGDLNGDGCSDLVVGAYGANQGSVFNTGRAYIYLGGSSPDTVPDFVLDGEERNDYFGFAVSAGGDIDCDSIADLCVGSYGCDIGDSTEVGKCFVFYGGPGLGGPADLALWSGAAHNEAFGVSVSLFGPDMSFPPYLAVGAEGNDDNGVDAGKTYVFTGPSPVPGWPDGEAGGAESGASSGHDVQALRGFTSSEAGVLVLSGAYEEALTGCATLLKVETAALPPRRDRESAAAVRGNPFLRGSQVEFHQGPGAEDDEFIITDTLGRVVYSGSRPASGKLIWGGRTNCGDLAAPGVYFCELLPSSRRGRSSSSDDPDTR